MNLVSEISEEELIQDVQRNFVIEVNGRNFSGKREQKAHNFKTLVEYLKKGEREKGHSHQLAIKLFRSAYESSEQVVSKKLRRGCTIKFYSK